MLSIFVLYAPSRRPQFEQFSRFLQRCRGYGDCQKLLVCDGPCDVRPAGYEVVEVKRDGKYFCWADAWSAAMAAVRGDKVLYLDCDRVVPIWYLAYLEQTLKDYEFVHPSKLFNLNEPVDDDGLFDPKKHWVERLSASYLDLPCRGPMSGTSAFTVKSYEFVGPLDRSYLSWGYPDLEYQEQIKSKGCTFRAVDADVYHLHHPYEIETGRFLTVNVWNGVRFFRKWKLPYTKRFTDALLHLGLTPERLLAMTLDEVMDV